MKICIFVEGCYPYVVGGVSSWIQQLITNIPEHQFIIYSVNDQNSKKGKFAYKLPPNVEHVYEIFLEDVFMHEPRTKGSRLSPTIMNEFEKLIFGKNADWGPIFDYFNKNKRNVGEFLMSADFFECIKEYYRRDFSKTKFVDFTWSMRSMYLTLFHVLRQRLPKADVYHTIATGYAGILASAAKACYHKPLLLSEHGIYTREREEEIIKADWVQGYFKNLWIDYFYTLSRCTYDSADAVVALFQGAAEIQSQLSCKAEKIQIIPNGIKIEDYSALPQKSADDLSINIGAILRVTPIKDVKTLLQAFNIVKREVPNAKLYIMGPDDEDPDYARECYELLKFLGTQDVVFTGMVNVKEYIGKMDILTLSSISEGMPLVILEAMAAKKPFVSTNVGSCKELIYGRTDTLGQCGYVVPVMNAMQMASRLIELCKDADKRKAFGEAGYERAKSQYTFESFIDQYRRLYANSANVGSR